METSSWREFLRTIISVPAERNRIAAAAGMRSITLTRWTSENTQPRPENLRRLIQALPAQHRRHFQELLEQEVGPILITSDNMATGTEEIPYTLVDEILRTRATTADGLRFWAICSMILQHALRHLDPEPLGMAITVILCMPPCKDGKIHSLRERKVHGTPPWKSEGEQQLMFLGAEALAGYVVATNRPAAIRNLRDNTNYIPSQLGEHEVSSAAAPLLFAGRIAGCVLFSSTQEGYFDESRFPHIQTYTDLMTLALDPEDFYPPSLIDLRIMPPLSVQLTHLADYQKRVQQILRDSVLTGHSIPFPEAELIAWRHLEELLLNLPQQSEHKDTVNTK
ncbi:MAG TPA: GAF domain-containing protein [Ktedonobacteraceae bacterium]|nr:GAF domain-containing protein [Ktedonobacteraceae bacterium]